MLVKLAGREGSVGRPASPLLGLLLLWAGGDLLSARGVGGSEATSGRGVSGWTSLQSVQKIGKSSHTWHGLCTSVKSSYSVYMNIDTHTHARTPTHAQAAIYFYIALCLTFTHTHASRDLVLWPGPRGKSTPAGQRGEGTPVQNSEMATIYCPASRPRSRKLRGVLVG